MMAAAVILKKKLKNRHISEMANRSVVTPSNAAKMPNPLKFAGVSDLSR